MSTPDEQQIENQLRHSPRPRPPEDLKARLITQAQSTRQSRTPQGAATRNLRPSFSQRWWRILAPASFLLVCLFVLGVQQKEIRNLKQSIQTLTERIETGAAGTETDSRGQTTLPAAGAAAEAEEIARLKVIVSQLSADISRMEQMRVENQNLRTQLSTPSPSRLSPEELAAVEDSQAAALKIHCVNNMKQMGLSVRVWAQDNQDINPPDIISMTNELGTPKILCCPADPGHSATDSWSSYTDANCSYEYFAPSATDRETTRVLFRCPVHGNIGLCDGSVHAEVGKTHPEWLVQREGKLYLDSH